MTVSNNALYVLHFFSFSPKSQRGHDKKGISFAAKRALDELMYYHLADFDGDRYTIFDEAFDELAEVDVDKLIPIMVLTGNDVPLAMTIIPDANQCVVSTCQHDDDGESLIVQNNIYANEADATTELYERIENRDFFTVVNPGMSNHTGIDVHPSLRNIWDCQYNSKAIWVSKHNVSIQMFMAQDRASPESSPMYAGCKFPLEDRSIRKSLFTNFPAIQVPSSVMINVDVSGEVLVQAMAETLVNIKKRN